MMSLNLLITVLICTFGALIFFVVLGLSFARRRQSLIEELNKDNPSNYDKNKGRRMQACWFYEQEKGKKVGPVLREELEMMLGNLELPPDTMVWASFLGEWQAANTIAEIKPYVTQVPEKTVKEGEGHMLELELMAVLSDFSLQVDVPLVELKARIRGDDHTGLSLRKVVARKLGVGPEVLLGYLQSHS